MRGAAQIENTIKNSKNYTNNISMNYERWQAHDLTSDQVHYTGIPRQVLYEKGSSEFVLKNYLKLLKATIKSYFQAQIYK